MIDELLSLEERFWTGDPAFYRENLTDDAVMVFPEPVGVLTRESAIEGIASGARWNEVGIREPGVMRVADGAALLTYRARARREGGRPYSTLASSLYVERAGAWRLAFHQQTPDMDGGGQGSPDPSG